MSSNALNYLKDSYILLALGKSMPQRLKVLLLIPHLGGGGAEQVTALLARGLSRAKYEVHLGLITQSGAVHSGAGQGQLPPEFNLHSLGARRVRAGAFRLLRLVR